MYRIMINFTINFFKILYIPLILPLRFKARIYVYNYLLQNKKYYLFPYTNFDISNNYFININNNLTIPLIEIKMYKFYFYYYFIWIWLDDKNLDIINTNEVSKLVMKYKVLNFFLEKDLKEILLLNIDNNFNFCNINLGKYKLLCFLSIFFNKNNYYYLNFYSNKKTNVYTKLVFINNYPMYKI